MYMKRLFLILAVIGFISSAHADCGATGISIFPKNYSIKQNSIFMIEGYAQGQAVILKLDKKQKVYLKSGEIKIRLIVSEICVGQFDLTQAILKPETELITGTEYTVCFDGLPEYETLTRYNTNTAKYEPVKYKILEENDNLPPQLLSKPKIIDKSIVLFGCGPAIYIMFDNPIRDSSEILIKTILKNKTTNKENTYYISPELNTIKVGHGMCSGAFIFNEGKEYEIEFSFMDASGNRTNWEGERISFTKPEIKLK